MFNNIIKQQEAQYTSSCMGGVPPACPDGGQSGLGWWGWGTREVDQLFPPLIGVGGDRLVGGVSVGSWPAWPCPQLAKWGPVRGGDGQGGWPAPPLMWGSDGFQASLGEGPQNVGEASQGPHWSSWLPQCVS